MDKEAKENSQKSTQVREDKVSQDASPAKTEEKNTVTTTTGKENGTPKGDTAIQEDTKTVKENVKAAEAEVENLLQDAAKDTKKEIIAKDAPAAQVQKDESVKKTQDISSANTESTNNATVPPKNIKTTTDKEKAVKENVKEVKECVTQNVPSTQEKKVEAVKKSQDICSAKGEDNINVTTTTVKTEAPPKDEKQKPATEKEKTEQEKVKEVKEKDVPQVADKDIKKEKIELDVKITPGVNSTKEEKKNNATIATVKEEKPKDEKTIQEKEKTVPKKVEETKDEIKPQGTTTSNKKEKSTQDVKSTEETKHQAVESTHETPGDKNQAAKNSERTQDNVPPEAGIPFSLFLSSHLYLAIFQFISWYSEFPGSSLVISIVALGGVCENWRLMKGAMLGERGLDKTLTTISFLMLLSVQPLLWIPLGDALARLIGFNFLGILCKMFGVMSCVRGLNELMIDVIDNYDVKQSGDLYRHVLKPEKRTMKLFLPAFLLAGFTLLVSFVCWIVTGHKFSLILQLLCLTGQYMATKDRLYGTHLSHFLEVVFLTDIAYLHWFVCSVA